LAEDVRSELSAGQMRDQVSPVDRGATRVGSKRKATLIRDLPVEGIALVS